MEFMRHFLYVSPIDFIEALVSRDDTPVNPEPILEAGNFMNHIPFDF